MTDSFMDCSSLSISYAATGLASVSLTVYTKVGATTPYTLGGPGFELTAGGITFKGFILEQQLNPANEVEYNEYRVTAVAFGKK
jgi:hypothetical protein